MHIHPARQAPLTIRIKANALKSVVCCFVATGDLENINIALLNGLRQRYLGLPPIAQNAGIAEIEKVTELLKYGL